MIDLHAHSTFSDGTLTPRELAVLGKEVGLTALALTDHDCTDGVGLFLEACGEVGLRGIGGVEISAGVAKGTMHILGYFIDTKEPGLQEVLRKIRNGREIRNEEILGKLNSLGVSLDWEEVAQYAGEDVVGRPHFAQALIAKGAVKDKQSAFDRYLAKGKPAYADRFRLSPEDSIAAIRTAGGVPVLAHPFTLGLGCAELVERVREFKAQGLCGIEVYYSEHSPAQVSEYLSLAETLGLIVTGGSDFHGEGNPSVRLGTGFGKLRVPDELVDALERCRPVNRLNADAVS